MTDYGPPAYQVT